MIYSFTRLLLVVVRVQCDDFRLLTTRALQHLVQFIPGERFGCDAQAAGSQYHRQGSIFSDIQGHITSFEPDAVDEMERGLVGIDAEHIPVLKPVGRGHTDVVQVSDQDVLLVRQDHIPPRSAAPTGIKLTVAAHTDVMMNQKVTSSCLKTFSVFSRAQNQGAGTRI